MIETVIRRAGRDEMRGVAERLEFAFGTDSNGALIDLGIVKPPWFVDADGRLQLPPLPSLPEGASESARRDDSVASGLRLNSPSDLGEALLAARRAIERATTRHIELAADGYTGNALGRAMTNAGDALLPADPRSRRDGDAPDLRRAIATVRRIEERMATLQNEFESVLAGRGSDDGVEVVVERAIFDAALVQALKPLSAADRHLLIERRSMPEHLSDARIVAALFRAPAALSPLRQDEMTAVAQMSFARIWPKTSQVASSLSEMSGTVRKVLATAVLEVGKLIAPSKPHDAFKRISTSDARWMLDVLAPSDPRASMARQELTD